MDLLFSVLTQESNAIKGSFFFKVFLTPRATVAYFPFSCHSSKTDTKRSKDLYLLRIHRHTSRRPDRRGWCQMRGGLAFCSHSRVSYPGSWISAPSQTPSKCDPPPSSFLSPSPSLPSPHCSAWDLRGRQGRPSGAYKPQPPNPPHMDHSPGTRAPADTALGNSIPHHTHTLHRQWPRHMAAPLGER